MSGDFPRGWRYNLLKLDTKRNAWVNAISYRSDTTLKRLGEFAGTDVDGGLHFTGRGGEDNVIHGHPVLKDGVEAASTRDGYAIGIFIKTCKPNLVIVDCDSTVETVANGNTARLVVRRGRDQLLRIFQEHGERVPHCPAVRGNREGHGYLIFKQNPLVPINSRRIKPGGAQFDVLGAGHQVHWTCGNRALVAGRELLEDPPELPRWFASRLTRQREETPSAGPIGLDLRDGGWGTAFMEAVLNPVTPTGAGWNQRLFNAACTLAENGVSFPEICELVLERCQPESEHDHRAALDSIASAWRKTTGEAVPDE